MKMKRISTLLLSLTALLAGLQLTSCSEHEDNIYTHITTGSILLSDNRIVSATGYDASTMQAIGVVMGIREDSVWVVSNKELGQYAYLDTLQTVDNVSSDAYALCGTENTAALLQSDRKAYAARAVAGMASPVRGWSLPSIGELRMLSAALPAVGKSMEVIGGDKFLTSQYLSSTQDGSNSQTEELYANCITLQSGYVTSMSKTEKAEVRAVLRIKIR